MWFFTIGKYSGKGGQSITGTEGHLTRGLLEQVSRKLIGSYRERRFSYINAVYAHLEPEKAAHESPDVKRKFYHLIKLYHPDSLQFHRDSLQAAIQAEDEHCIAFYRAMALPPDGSSFRGITKPHDDPFDIVEEYAVDGELYTEEAGSAIGEAEFEMEFIEALNAACFGNLEQRLEPVDLMQMRDSIELPDLGIHDIEGIQYCIGITGLNLSGNCLSNIFLLADLVHLVELDLSDNQISDIEALQGLESLETLFIDNNDIESVEPLLSLPELQFVSLGGNPLTNGQLEIAALRSQGVIVVGYQG